MAEEFKPITTQEEFNTAISARLERERQKFADYEDLKAQVGTLTTERDTYKQQVEDRDATIRKYETDSVKTRIAQEKGLPASMASRLAGETEEEITKDADNLAQIFRTAKGTAPMFEGGNGGGNDTDAALRQMLQGMNL